MKNVLLINGHEPYYFAQGKYNSTLFNEIEKNLKSKFSISKTIINNGYDIKEEQEKFKNADLIIFQFPIYWFSTPAIMKKYIDKVYEYGIFFGVNEEGKEYGFNNGKMNGKKYMFSVTFNAPEDTFNRPDSFFEGNSLEQFLFHMHKTNQFCGMKPLKSFASYDIVKNPQIEKDLKRLSTHISETILMYTVKTETTV